MTRKRKDRGAQFIRNNLELLGFGTRREALVQTVKELFENALDATQSLGSEVWEDKPLELLRVSVKLNEDTGNIDIVCADTGQIHDTDACLKITTTSKSDGVLYVQLRIDPDSEETAVVKKVAHFKVDENHQHFSGTEMRLSIPCPHEALEIENAVDTLALYFQSLRYTAPPFLAVQFEFDVGEISMSFDCQHREEPIDRFATDLGASADDILYAVHDGEFTSVSCVALMLGDMELNRHKAVEICLLRYANHAPMINSEDFFLCGITKGVCTWKVWKKYGLRCQRTSSYLVSQLVARPLRALSSREVEDEDPIRLILAIDVCVADSALDSGIKFGTQAEQRNMSAIGALRELEKDKKGPNNAGLKELFLNLPTRIRQSGPVKGGINFAVKSWKTSGRWLWVLSTTLLVTLVPLSIEMLREEQTNEVVKELVSKGFSYNQIQGMGYMVSQPDSTLAAPTEGAAQ
ncbi:putative mitochondrial protein [Phytophthora megakarya]|uniref:Putative mitochondrial protein n=1 Tax=Phytophthora megakarya TaxID=4795 RepID=A0A225UWZ3_9STRA|nr:putative mitochondrial protein [Phytophthora megakarya]